MFFLQRQLWFPLTIIQFALYLLSLCDYIDEYTVAIEEILCLIKSCMQIACMAPKAFQLQCLKMIWKGKPFMVLH